MTLVSIHPRTMGTLAAAFMLLVAFTPRASAQVASDSVAARALFEQGLAFVDTGQWSEGIDCFRRALALRDSAVIAYNLGVALAHENHPVEAAERFRRVMRDDEIEASVRSDASRALEAADAAMGWVVSSWDGDSTGAALLVDSEPRPIELFGAPMPLDPGTHAVILVRGDFEIAAGSIAVAAGERATLALTTLDVPVETRHEVPAPVDDADVGVHLAASGAGTDPSANRDESSDPAPWIGLGVGVGAVVLGGVIVLAIVLTPTPEGMAHPGSLGLVEIGR